MNSKPLLLIVTLSILLLGAVIGLSVAQQSELPLVSDSEGEPGYSNSALVLVIDISGSMNTSAVFNSTLAAAQALVEEVDGQIPIAIVSFGDTVQVAQSYSSDPTVLTAALNSLRVQDSALLYDGALTGIEEAASLDVENPTVLLFSDSSDQNRSASGRNQALTVAGRNAVTVHTVALEFNGTISAETDYLLELAQATGGTYSEVTVAQAESGELNTIALEIAEDALDDNVVTPAEEVGTIGSIEDTQSGESLVIEEEDTEVDPLGGQSLIEQTPPPENVAIPEGDNLVLPIGNILPIRIEVPDSDVVRAELSINGVKLVTFTQPTDIYEYDLDLGSLRDSGSYRITFNTTNEDNVLFGAEFEFDVVVLPPTSLTDGAEEEAEGEDVEEGALLVEPESTANDPSLPRQVLIDGVPISSLELVLTEEDGLELSENQLSEMDRRTQEDLLDIITRPFQYIPPEITSLFTTQRPGIVTAIIIVMTVVLLPQGLFTLYWMTYTWVDTRRLKRSQPPEEFYEPHYSFTALLPARREEQVIYDTIMATAKIDYPEHLKETLVLIRDEDDDETIAETKRAIDDLRRSFEERGEEWPNNVHLITFTDGPKNKPNGLNRGYKASTKDVICIFDAEDSPHPEIYNVINTVMLRDEADVVQSGVQLMNFEAPWFSAFNVLEYFFWFKSGLHAFTHEANVTPLGGNTVFFKKESMDLLAAQDTEKGYRAWDEGLLTEDADVGFRLTALGQKITIVYGSKQATQEETPHNIEQFIKQRTRWCQGFYEIFVKGDWTRLPTARQRIASIYILLNSLLQASVLLFLPVGAFILLTQELPVPIALLSWLPFYLMLIQMIINLIGIREFTLAYGLKLPFLFRLRMMLYYYPYQILLAAGAMRAIVRFLTNQSSWEKTAHSNLHRKTA